MFVKKRSTKRLILFWPNRNLLESLFNLVSLTFSLEHIWEPGYGLTSRNGASLHRNEVHSSNWQASKTHFPIYFMLACLLLFHFFFFFKSRWPPYRGPLPPPGESWKEVGRGQVMGSCRETKSYVNSAVNNCHFCFYRHQWNSEITFKMWRYGFIMIIF